MAVSQKSEKKSLVRYRILGKYLAYYDKDQDTINKDGRSVRYYREFVIKY